MYWQSHIKKIRKTRESRTTERSPLSRQYAGALGLVHIQLGPANAMDADGFIRLNESPRTTDPSLLRSNLHHRHLHPTAPLGEITLEKSGKLYDLE